LSDILETAQKLDPGAYIELFELDLNAFDVPTILRATTTGHPTSNLAKHSEALDQWSTAGATVQLGAVAAPSPSFTAAKVKEAATTDVHAAYGVGTAKPAKYTAYTASVYAKAAERAHLWLVVVGDDLTHRAHALFNLNNGDAVLSAGLNGFTVSSVRSTRLRNGWYRLIMSFASDASQTVAVRAHLSTGAETASTDAYAGTLNSGAYVWGAQINLGADAMAYLATSDQPIQRGMALLSFGGNIYPYIAVEATGFEWSGKGPLPTPRIRVGNANRVLQGYAVDYKDLVGAKVTRTRTFARYLDLEPYADATQTFPLDVYFVERKVTQTKLFIEWELASAMDQEGKMLPGRQVLRQCRYRYRRWDGAAFDYAKATCPYVGVPTFNARGQVVASAQDVCGKKLSDCILRFGNVDLPFGGFPGVGMFRTAGGG
jgi:lambda family phage minor tail protein L